MLLDTLSPSQHEAICHISQQGMGQAAEMLSRLLHKTIQIEIVDSWMSDHQALRQNGADVCSIYMAISGDISGGLMFSLSLDSADRLSSQLLGRLSGDLFTEPASSALKEVGNIIASSFLASLDNQLGLRAMPAPPILCRAPINELLDRYGSRLAEPCLIVQTCLNNAAEEGGPMQGAIYLFSDSRTVDRLVAQL